MKNSRLFTALGILLLLAPAPVLPTAFATSPTTLVLPVSIDVPAAAKATLARLYPDVKNAKWEKEDGNYEVGFTHQGKQLSLVIDAKGAVLETETTMTVSALPESVRSYVTKHHAGKSIKEAAEIVDAKGRKRYEAEVGGKDLLFDEKGAFIK